MADPDPYEQIIELIKMLRPMATSNQEAIHRMFLADEVAQETSKMMSKLGLLDEDALANALAKMVPAKPAEPAFHANGAPAVLPLMPQNQPPPGPFAGGMPSYPTPDTRGPYGVAPPPNPGGWYGAPPQPSISSRPPIPGPHVAPPIPGLQNLSANDANMVMTALAMSQAEVDMLPPQQRAIFMQLRSMMPGR